MSVNIPCYLSLTFGPVVTLSSDLYFLHLNLLYQSRQYILIIMLTFIASKIFIIMRKMIIYYKSVLLCTVQLQTVFPRSVSYSPLPFIKQNIFIKVY